VRALPTSARRHHPRDEKGKKVRMERKYVRRSRCEKNAPGDLEAFVTADFNVRDLRYMI
jgi:hypothetical protein